jgi:UDP:flavonoid glycosyltransferase YjiC (YdhE family)
MTSGVVRVRLSTPERRKRVLIFTIPNAGHLNVLKRMVGQYRDEYEFRLVLVDRTNTPPDVTDVGVPVVTPTACGRFINTPAGAVFARACDLLDECLALARAFDPDLVMYDFCAVEGYFVGQVLGIRSWCSIPGLIGPLVDHGYLARSVSSADNRAALAAIRDRYGVSVRPDQVELVSNSLFLPAELNLLWSYPAVTPANFTDNRHPARYRFVGYPVSGRPARRGRCDRPLVYLSLGTEVMDNLWYGQRDTRDGVRRCVAGLAERWASWDVEVVFAAMDRPVLARYPANWRVYAAVDQQDILSRADVFVTHGGSNSLHEAVVLQVPMVVAPFFGDQLLIGRRVRELGIGIALAVPEGTDKDTPKDHLNDGLAERMDEAVREILADDRYRRSYAAVPLDSTPPLAELDVTVRRDG